MKHPNKYIQYTHKIDGGSWTIWDGEDFLGSSILLYNDETGEDFAVLESNFARFFKPLKAWHFIITPVYLNHEIHLR